MAEKKRRVKRPTRGKSAKQRHSVVTEQDQDLLKWFDDKHEIDDDLWERLEQVDSLPKSQ